jgi:hypothetical protein
MEEASPSTTTTGSAGPQIIYASGEQAELDREIYATLCQNAAFRDLLRDVGQRYSSIRIKSSNETRVQGRWNPENQTIYLGRHLSRGDRFSTFLFEFCNASIPFEKLKGNRDKLHELAKLGVDLPEEAIQQLADNYEYLEQGTVELHHRIMAYGISHLGWQKNLDEYREVVKKVRLERVTEQRILGHTSEFVSELVDEFMDLWPEWKKSQFYGGT